MTPDLRLVAYACLLTFVMNMFASAFAGRIWTTKGRKESLGARDEVATPGPAAGRAKRAVANMYESLPLFIGLVPAAHLGQCKPDMVILGARIWLIARLAYWPVYISGVPVVRSLMWAVSIAGLGMIFSAIVTAGA